MQHPFTNLNRLFFRFERGVYVFYKKTIKPKSGNEDLKRREFILNIILFFTIIALVIFFFSLSYNALIWGKDYSGLSPLAFLI